MSRNKIFLLGEAWGRDEEAEGLPFVGMAGHILNSMLRQVGIKRDDCYVSNVFNLRPQPSNDVSNLCGPKAGGIPGLPSLSGKYVRMEYAPELTRLHKELENEKPNIVIALGATAAWAMLGTSGIRAIRGSPALGRGGLKVLPTYHPSAVGRDWTLRPIVLADLDKAARESAYPDLRRPNRFIHVEPTLNDLLTFEKQYIIPSVDLSIDIETKEKQITCLGFAPTTDRCLVVPFYDPMKKDGNYWPSLTEELIAWGWVRRMCGLRKRLVFQNGLYDMHFLWRSYGITCPHATDDTMLMHHALQPEMEKGLGFMGSLYTDEASWKFMRDDHDTIKKED